MNKKLFSILLLVLTAIFALPENAFASGSSEDFAISLFSSPVNKYTSAFSLDL